MRLPIGQWLADRKSRWVTRHKWFAWCPIVTSHGDVVWLETVDRILYGSSWEYFLIEQQRSK